jgi:TatD DNase family protein
MQGENPQLFDIHSHLNDEAFESDRAEVIAHMEKEGVWTITVGTDRDMSQKACDISMESEGLFASIGVHPTDNKTEGFDEMFYKGLLERYEKIVAVGECGLDYFRTPAEELKSEKRRQEALFEEQLEFAVSNNLPLMIHCRSGATSDTRAHKDIIEILSSKKKQYGDVLRGNIHFFAEDVEAAKKYYELDFATSFTGVITFAPQYHEVIEFAPATHIMSETDAPYVAPVPYRGKRCEPLHVAEVVKTIADVRGETLENTQKLLVSNAVRVFGISAKN